MKKIKPMASLFIIFFLLLFANQPIFQTDSALADEAVQTLETIVVTAEKLSEYIKNHPQQIVILDQKEIEERNFLEIGEAIDSMHGVDVKQRDSGTSISIRGGGGSGKVLVLIDGRPLNSGQYGGIDLKSIPIEIIKSISVFKPPVPVWLGQGSSAGAINLITKKNLSSRRSKKTTARIKASAGSFGYADISCYGIKPFQDGSLMLAAGGGHKDGRRTNSYKDKGNFSFNLNKKNKQQTQYALNGRYYHVIHGSPGPKDNRTPDARQNYDKFSLDFQMKGLMGETGDYSLKSYVDYKDLEDKSQTGLKSTLEVYKLGIKGESAWKVDNDQALRIGGKVEQDAVDHTITGEHHRNKFSLHSQLDQNFGPLAMTMGIRGDYSNDYEFFPAANAGLSFLAGPFGLLKTNAGYSVNIPSFGQLYQPSHGSIDQVRGNPDLSEENIYSYDIGLEKKIGKNFIFEIAFFRTTTRDLIAYQRGLDMIYRPVNIRHSYKYGSETSLQYKWANGLVADFNYIWQKTRNKDMGNDLAYSPNHKTKLTFKYVLKTKTRLETIIRTVSSQYSDVENTKSEKIDSYSTADLKIIQPVKIKQTPVEFFLHINNIFDADYEIHYGYPDDGFRFIGGFSINL